MTTTLRLLFLLALACAPASAQTYSKGGLGIYGDGSDGTSTGVCCGALASNCTMSRDIYCTSITTGAHVLTTANYRIFSTGKVTISVGGKISNTGASATDSGGAGASARVNGSLVGGANGGNGSCNGGNNGSGGGNSAGMSLAVSSGGGGGTAPGGISYFGGFGAPHSASYGSVRSAPLVQLGVFLGSSFWDDLNNAISNMSPLPTTPLLGGGSAGGGGAGAATSCGGGGGAGAGPLILSAPIIDCNGTIEAKGGGGLSRATLCPTDCGGGGGGAGAPIIVIRGSRTGTCTITNAGGAGGAGGGAGTAGAAGSAGPTLIEIVN